MGVQYWKDYQGDLEKTWTLCLRMWRWIKDRVRAGDSRDVNELKWAWLYKHVYTREEYPENGCFFCDYDGVHGRYCSKCPGRLMQDNFHCNTVGVGPTYHDDPAGFYLWLRRLNDKRLREARDE